MLLYSCCFSSANCNVIIYALKCIFFAVNIVEITVLCFIQVITVNSNDLILEAFNCMKDTKIGGVPVVEGPNRKLVGSVSIRDIRFLLLRPDLFSNFRYHST
jgi:predicted transcriptional regulator